ncbi:GNAT family N-acetyltransferase [Simiduia sp. 21SJ11W-1]|uniref:GNAT family N-acetyltransferase n=1 Tax=Simiduia sp. 21SJ11W-1 TaxID=2909669 RepID=UPI00209EDD3D|nr:GNAT family N-acetyltransferase [Simiduia sp. 21SJ11W-1]UTA47373.1 GNAT family N-acetyltransferase [Simiduia sp. 21SJ11W-1]
MQNNNNAPVATGASSFKGREHYRASPFRTVAWASAWLETYGQQPGVKIYDIGGRGHPLEMVYTAPRRLKKVLPVQCLALVGCGSSALASPRSEYNSLIIANEVVGPEELLKQTAGIAWNMLELTDLDVRLYPPEMLSEGSRTIHYEKTYAVAATNFAKYKASLSKSTRVRYFNKRDRLLDGGNCEFISYPLCDLSSFIAQLNSFHLARWGRPCYSGLSIQMITKFLHRFVAEGGAVNLSVLNVNARAVSVLFDIEYKGVRYNIQSGYKEDFHPQIKLGSVHLGWGIEEALSKSLAYDCLAGEGREANYKASLANTSAELAHARLFKGWIARMAPAYRAYKRIKPDIELK